MVVWQIPKYKIFEHYAKEYAAKDAQMAKKLLYIADLRHLDVRDGKLERKERVY
jgi:hypothetical protein